MNALKKIIEKGKELNACDLLHDNTTIREAAMVIFMPQGREFCQKHSFPSLDDLEALQAENAQFLKRKRIYVNEDKIEIFTRSTDCMFAGESENQIHCEGAGCYNIILAHGAKAYISASDYAVVRVTKIGKGCKHQFVNLDKTAVLL